VQYETLDKEEILKVIKGEKLPGRIMSSPNAPIKMPTTQLPVPVAPNGEDSKPPGSSPVA
jgi:ATP-dependent metalloprotease